MGRIISQKNKSKVIRAFRAPSAPVVMSLMALILVCAAPALVSVIDDTYTYEGSSEVQLLDIDSTEPSLIRLASTPEIPAYNDASVSYIPASENDGTFLIALNDPSEIDNVRFARFKGIDVAPLMSGMGVKVVTSSDVTVVHVSLSNSDDNSGTQILLTQSEADTSVWTGSLSTVDIVKIRSGVYDLAYVDMHGPNEIFDMEIYSVGEYSIPYGEIIIGATGVLLIVCAILATPWVGTTGLTVKRRRSA